MTLLAIETTSPVSSVALVADGVLAAECAWRSPDAAAGLLPALATVLRGASLDHVDRLVVSAGPGSWTGTRIGISFAKGLASGEAQRIYVLSTMDILAWPFSGMPVRLCCLIPCRRGTFWYAVYGNRCRRQMRQARLPDIAREAGADALFTGPGVEEIPRDEADRLGIALAPAALRYPRASSAAFLAAEHLDAGVPSLPAEPFYHLPDESHFPCPRV